MKSQLKYDFEKKEATQKAEQDKKDAQATVELQKQKVIRNSVAAGFAVLLLFSVVVFRQRNKISKGKKRSDELLLNILPEEVAEELKQKGSAEAKHFDNVTVMFTDFKGFTQISEKLSPRELVAEIDYCFKSFDRIIDKYNLEKIKTIGDSYMCAGGLPVANSTHATDIINAALEILEFMKTHLAERTKQGKEVFEIRIGIHSGPVVAGIVGLKKFAYDIWGDTVNTSSRMESSGEPGKINISGDTYELVKTKFSCTHRGKIKAKNKGEIDMYFVEGVA
jgi:class 3 adenylate cyclase